MIRHIIYMVQNDTGPPVDFDVVNDDEERDAEGNIVVPATPYDLTGCVVRFKIKAPNGTITNTGHQACLITEPLEGKCRYSFQTGDIPKGGRYSCDVEVTDASLRVQTEFTVTEIQVREENG